MDEIFKCIKKNCKVSFLQNKKDYYQLEKFLNMKGKVIRIFKDIKWAANHIYKYYDKVNFKDLISW